MAGFALLAALVWCGVVGGFCRWLERLRARDDAVYAQTLFLPIVSGFEVLQSRVWHPPGAEAWDCTYAIIRLPSDKLTDPPTRRGDDVQWWLKFGGNWHASPIRTVPCDNCRDALRFCARYWPETGAALSAAVAQPGAWVSTDSIGETLDIWAPAAGLAAHIRFGD